MSISLSGPSGAWLRGHDGSRPVNPQRNRVVDDAARKFALDGAQTQFRGALTSLEGHNDSGSGTRPPHAGAADLGPRGLGRHLGWNLMQTLQEVEDGEGAVQAPGPGDAPSAKAAGNEEAAAPPKSTYAVAWPMGYTPSQDQLKAVQDICDKYMGDKGPDVLDKIWREIREKNLYPFDFAGQGRVA